MIKNLNEIDRTQNQQIGVLTDYVKSLSIDVAAGFAGQLFSRVIGHDRMSRIGRPCRDAPLDQNLLTCICNHFATEVHEQFFDADL
jgi:hypothetical protein